MARSLCGAIEGTSVKMEKNVKETRSQVLNIELIKNKIIFFFNTKSYYQQNKMKASVHKNLREEKKTSVYD